MMTELSFLAIYQFLKKDSTTTEQHYSIMCDTDQKNYISIFMIFLNNKDN